MATTAHAQDAATIDYYCGSLAVLAESAASAHQQGVALAAMLSKLAESDTDEANRAVMRAIIVSVYDRPRYSTEEVQGREIAEMRDETHVACLKQWAK
jgi:hypothetical protein